MIGALPILLLGDDRSRGGPLETAVRSFARIRLARAGFRENQPTGTFSIMQHTESRSGSAGRESSGNGSRLLTVDEFRRQFFSETGRPTRARVRNWIANGTRDGVFLPGFQIEGAYFIDAERVDEFFQEYALRTRTETAKKRDGRRRSPETRAAEALGALRRQYGF